MAIKMVVVVVVVVSVHREGHYEMMAGVCLSVYLSIACLNVTREQKGLGSPKLARWLHIVRVTREPI